MPPAMASPRSHDLEVAHTPEKNGTRPIAHGATLESSSAPAHSKRRASDSSDDDEPRTLTRTVRATRNRLQLVDHDESEGESASSPSPPPPRRSRLGRGVKEPSPTTVKDGSPPSVETAKRSRGRPRRSDAAKGADEDDAADYVHIQVGDCVLLDSGDAVDHYVALVSSVQLSQSSSKPTGFTAQWYYKPDDIPDDVRATIEGSILPNEVFLSPHKDRNSVDAVIGLCNVVGKEEYIEMQSEIDRGFREKSTRPQFVCRFKYYPSRPTKKALELLKEEDIRGGLGPQKPKVGDEFQAVIPELLPSKPTGGDDGLPWRFDASPPVGKATQVWSRHIVSSQELAFRNFCAVLDPLRLGVGNVVRYFQNTDETTGHVRCIVVKHASNDVLEVCVSTGHVKQALKSQVLSPFADDAAYKILYASRFNLTRAVFQCSKELLAIDQREREAFRQEVAIFAKLAAQREAAAASDSKKRRK